VTVGLAGRHFNHRKGAQRCGHASRLHRAANLHDAPVLSRKDHIDWKLHAEGMHGRAGGNHQRVAGIE
jgi:hypothetical protein